MEPEEITLHSSQDQRTGYDPPGPLADEISRRLGPKPIIIEKIDASRTRADIQNLDPGTRYVAICQSYEEANALRTKILSQLRRQGNENISNIYFIVAEQGRHPIRSEKVDFAVDVHNVTHVGEKKYENRRTRLVQFGMEALAFFLRNKFWDLPLIFLRPVYIERDEHVTMLATFDLFLADKARILKKGGKFLFSIATVSTRDRSDRYYAIHHQQGEIVLSRPELEKLLQKHGFEIEYLIPGMAPKAQGVALESIAKVLAAALIGTKRIEKTIEIANRYILPIAHELVDRLTNRERQYEQRGIVKLLNYAKFPPRALVPPQGPGAKYKENFADRFVVLAVKKLCYY